MTSEQLSEIFCALSHEILSDSTPKLKQSVGV
jgi:hypothetical protein